ncbi:hypothetical protein FRC16_003541 [Serendipita sp. 398]|nr:hypothetical protein FRC16_003541 [Serendipita sp. 398]
MSEPRNQDQTEVDVVDVQQELLTEAESGTLGGEVSSSSSFPHPGEMPHPAFVVVSEADVESTGFPLKLKSKLKKMKSPKVMFVVAPALATVIRLPTRITVLRRQRTHSNQTLMRPSFRGYLRLQERWKSRRIMILMTKPTINTSRWKRNGRSWSTIVGPPGSSISPYFVI